MAATETAETREEPEPVIPLLAMVGVAAVLALVFWVLRHAPPDYDCGDKPPGRDARLDDYRAGLRTIHITAALVLAAALAWTSRERARVRGGDRPGRPTLIAVAITVLWAIGSLVNDDAASVLLLAGIISLLASPIVGLATLVLLALAWIRRGPPPRWRWPVVAGLGWFATFLLIPGHVALVLLQGDPLCLG